MTDGGLLKYHPEADKGREKKYTRWRERETGKKNVRRQVKSEQEVVREQGDVVRERGVE